MSMPDNDSQRKTMAIRVEPDIHAELSLIAQLRGHTLADEHLQAVLDHIDHARDETDLADRAEEAILAIEREAAIRRDAINRLRRSKPASTTDASDGPSSTEPPAPAKRPRKAAADAPEG